VIRTLLDRNKNIVTKEKDRKQEEHHIHTAITRCRYPDWSINKVERQMETVTWEVSTQLPEQNRTTVAIA